MQALPLIATLSVADQIDEADVATLAAAGFKAIVCHRPDAEGGTPSERIGAACARHAIKFFFQPVEYSRLGVADGDSFGQILQQCEQPVLAYCRSGRRSTALWAIAAAPLAGVPAVVERAGRIGVALDELRGVLTQSAARTDPPYAPTSDPAARQRFVRLWSGGN
jgi:sulfide:quinone oxidoreductase